MALVDLIATHPQRVQDSVIQQQKWLQQKDMNEQNMRLQDLKMQQAEKELSTYDERWNLEKENTLSTIDYREAQGRLAGAQADKLDAEVARNKRIQERISALQGVAPSQPSTSKGSEQGTQSVSQAQASPLNWSQIAEIYAKEGDYKTAAALDKMVFERNKYFSGLSEAKRKREEAQMTKQAQMLAGALGSVDYEDIVKNFDKRKQQASKDVLAGDWAPGDVEKRLSESILSINDPRELYNQIVKIQNIARGAAGETTKQTEVTPEQQYGMGVELKTPEQVEKFAGSTAMQFVAKGYITETDKGAFKAADEEDQKVVDAITLDIKQAIRDYQKEYRTTGTPDPQFLRTYLKAKGWGFDDGGTITDTPQGARLKAKEGSLRGTEETALMNAAGGDRITLANTPPGTLPSLPGVPAFSSTDGDLVFMVGDQEAVKIGPKQKDDMGYALLGISEALKDPNAAKALKDNVQKHNKELRLLGGSVNKRGKIRGVVPEVVKETASEVFNNQEKTTAFFTKLADESVPVAEKQRLLKTFAKYYKNNSDQELPKQKESLIK